MNNQPSICWEKSVLSSDERVNSGRAAQEGPGCGRVNECYGDFATINPAKLHRDDTIAVRFKRSAAMFLRFVTTRIDKDSHKSQGVFAASYALLDSDDLTREEWEHLRGMIIWFNANLPSPPKKFDSRRAIFWFKSTAEENIRKVWELVYVLREHGHHVEVHKCRRLGNVVWEDDFQVAAFPSESDGRITIQ